VRRWLAGVLATGVLVGGLAWWAQPPADPVSVDDIGDQVQTRADGVLPVFAGAGETSALYRFARERGDVLQSIPCTCGCAALGHTSNRSCYLKAAGAGRTTWTSHAAT